MLFNSWGVAIVAFGASVSSPFNDNEAGSQPGKNIAIPITPRTKQVIVEAQFNIGNCKGTNPLPAKSSFASCPRSNPATRTGNPLQHSGFSGRGTFSLQTIWPWLADAMVLLWAQ